MKVVLDAVVLLPFLGWPNHTPWYIRLPELAL